MEGDLEEGQRWEAWRGGKGLITVEEEGAENLGGVILERPGRGASFGGV